MLVFDLKFPVYRSPLIWYNLFAPFAVGQDHHAAISGFARTGRGRVIRRQLALAAPWEALQQVFSMDDVLNIAVQLEKNGEKAYRLAAGKSNQASLCAFMVWMADQEAAHAKWFEQLRDQAGTIEADPGLMEMGRQLLEEVVADQSFSLDDLEISRVATLQESIRVSIEFEKDTVIFYEMLAAFVQQGEVRALMEKIIEEEHRHIRMLQEFLGN